MIEKSKRKFIIFFILTSLIFVALSLLVHYDTFRMFDYSNMVSFQKYIPRNVDIPFSYISLTGSSEITLSVIALIGIAIFLRTKKIVFSLGLFILIFVIELMGKLFIFHPHPPSLFYRNSLNIRLPLGHLVTTNFSFPSGHMSRTTFIAVILIFLVNKFLNRKLKLPAILFVTLYILVVFISRIYLGEHWFSDVLGGLLLGSSMAFLTLSLF